MATTSDLTIIKKHILTKAQYEALEIIEPNDEYYVIDDDGGSVKYSNKQALTDEQKATAQKNIGVDILINQKADLNHTHEMSDVEGLPVALDGKADANHNHDAAYAAKNHEHSQYLTQHQDISHKQDKTDNSLLTTAKTIIGAINELWTKFKDYLKGIQHVTYAQLKTMRDSGTLVAGQWYHITDYMTTVANDAEARSAGHPFDLLVMATSVNTLSEQAKAINSSRDSNGYFANANLTAWKVWYCLDNDTKRFQWADTANGKGVIYRMIDEWQNDCPYDFKNVQFKRYKATALNEVINESINGQYYAYNGEMMNVEIANKEDFVWAYTFTLIDENADWVDYSIKKEGALDAGTDWGYLKQFKIGRCEYNHIRRIYTAVTIDYACYRTLMLNNIVLIATMNKESGLSGEMQMNDFGAGNYNMTVKDNPEKNTFGNKCYNNIVGSYSNTFGNGVSLNTFGNGVYWNTFGNGVSWNTFGNDCNRNTFGNDVYWNTFGNSVSWNTFGNDCGGNTFGNNCYYNTFGNGCGSNTFGNDCGGNTFGNSCDSNTFGNGVSWNTFWNSCDNNTFGNSCDSNTFGNGVYWNTFGNNCYYNTFGNDCGGNTFGNYVRYLTVFDGIHYVAVTGGSSDSSYIQNAQILNGTMGSDTNNRLQISFQASANYCQIAGLNSSGNLRIWTPADAY